MREFDALSGYPEPNQPRYVGPNLRTMHHRIIASYRAEDYFDGDRNYGYGGLKYDGRWIQVATNMAREYDLGKNSAVVHLWCERGFLLRDFQQLYPGIKTRGVETSDYAIATALPEVRPHIVKASLTTLPFDDREFDFVIAIGVIYNMNLADAIKCLKEIQRVGRGKSFITLGSYRTERDYSLFKSWTLLGCLILSEFDWVQVLKHCGYTGDYKFMNAQVLKLEERSD